ncbi:unnamed protein product, partial [Discosporangium mesarthrocarpum]
RRRNLQAVEGLLEFAEGNQAVSGSRGGIVEALTGEWRLLYTSSNAMEYNQGLTGLANTIPNARFRGVLQRLEANGLAFDAEYEEELVVGEDTLLPVIVTSDWEVKETLSLLSGVTTVAVSVSPKQIKYGFITVRSERWKPLRSMNLLDIAYLDGDIRVMRGQTARQNIFVFAKCL